MHFTSPPTSRWSDVFIASGAQLFSAAGAFLVMTTLVLRLEGQGASGLQVSALIIAEVLPMVLLAKLTGRMADRFDSRLLLVVMGLAQVAACFALAQASRYEAIVLGGVALATATAVVQPVRQALLPSMVTRDDLPKASAIGQTAGSIGMLIGPGLAGLLVGTVQTQMTLRIAALAFLGTTLAGLLLRTRRGRRLGETAAKLDSSPMPPWRLAGDRLYFTLVWGLAAVIALISAVNVVDVFFIRGTLDSSATVYGIVSSSWTVGMLMGAWAMARVIKPLTADGTVVMWMFISLAVVCALVAFSAAVPAAAWIIPLWIIGGAGNGAENVMMGTLLGRRVPPEVRGRAAAGVQARVQGAALLGFAAGGALLEVFSPRWVILGVGLMGVLGVIVVLPIIRKAVSDTLISVPGVADEALEGQPTPA